MKQQSTGIHKPFDVTLKWLLERDPISWARLLGATDFEDVTVIDSDLSTVVVAADKVLRIRAAQDWLLHSEFQSTYDSESPWRWLEYNVLLTRRQKLPVESVVVLLRPEADGPAYSGLLTSESKFGSEPRLLFRYRVIRLWELPVEAFLQGELATLPLAPLANVGNQQLPEVISAMSKRIESEASPAEQSALWTSTYLLLGLRKKPQEVAELLRGIKAMRESSTYQAILDEGRQEGSAREARRILLRSARRRFGDPSSDVISKIESVSDVEVLEALIDQMGDVASWNDLMALMPVVA